ncbi:MAG: 50S ribosomal protein L9 [Candidatus Peribacteraceae bacterium]
MEVLLLTDIPGVGKKNDLIVVKNGYALNHLLPMRKALVVTPNVRKRYAEQIKLRALEREHERQILTSASAALSGKTVHFTAKATKTGKLYAAISEEKILSALKQEHALELSAESVQIPVPIKTVGTHTVTLSVGSETLPLTVEVKAENKEQKEQEESLV